MAANSSPDRLRAVPHAVAARRDNHRWSALSNVQANLYSDLLLHHMGPSLADNMSQGVAGGDEFRTAPLWGLGQRIFFLHDGRTSDLVQTIQAHASSGNRTYPSFGGERSGQQLQPSVGFRPAGLAELPALAVKHDISVFPIAGRLQVRLARVCRVGNRTLMTCSHFNANAFSMDAARCRQALRSRFLSSRRAVAGASAN